MESFHPQPIGSTLGSWTKTRKRKLGPNDGVAVGLEQTKHVSFGPYDSPGFIFEISSPEVGVQTPLIENTLFRTLIEGSKEREVHIAGCDQKGSLNTVGEPKRSQQCKQRF